MTLKRLILSGLAVLVSGLIAISLLGSLFEPQVQNQLELYQTNILLQASAWQGFEGEVNVAQARRALLGDKPLEEARQQYQDARQGLQKALKQAVKNESEQDQELSPTRLQAQLVQVELNLGLLYARSGQTDKALQTWAPLVDPALSSTKLPLRYTANVLQGLWSEPARVWTDAEATLDTNLGGWFRYQALKQLYQLQQQPEALAALQAEEQRAAEQALIRLVLVAGLPTVGSFLGAVILIFWLVRGWLKHRSRQTTEPQAASDDLIPEPKLTVPWTEETILQVMVLWFTAFFGISLFLVPRLAGWLGIIPGKVSALVQAEFALVTYSLLMVTGLTILYLSIKPFVPRPATWLPLKLQGGWFWWGWAGYLAALPMVVVVSLISRSLLQDQGGANPILEIILQSRGDLTILLLFLTVSVLAPVFEETLFRGFFLTSLTRYLPTWGAIALSGAVFAIAHLNVADLLPLTVLGMVLGYVYLRSGNLLSSMLLHSIWNSGSFLGLLILSGGSH